MFARRCSALAATGVLALLITLAAAPLGAQTTIGVRGGVGAASLSGAGSDTRAGAAFDNVRYGLVMEVDAGIPLSGGLGVRIGMGLAQKGGGAPVPASVTTGRRFTQATAEFGYLQFSTLLSLSTDAEEGRITFGVLAGPYVAFNLSCNVALTTHHGPDTLPPAPPGIPNRVVNAGPGRMAADTGLACGEDGTSEVESSDFGLAFGGGFEVKLSDSLGLAFELIYAAGLSDIDDEGQRNRQVIVQSGLVFAIG